MSGREGHGKWVENTQECLPSVTDRLCNVRIIHGPMHLISPNPSLKSEKGMMYHGRNNTGLRVWCSPSPAPHHMLEQKKMALTSEVRRTVPWHLTSPWKPIQYTLQ